MKLSDAYKMVETGKICDAKTVIMLQWWKLHQKKIH